MFSKQGRYLLLIILVMLVGFALRVHELEYQSMWSDEGLSLYRARQPLGTIFANTITVDGVDTKDTNPAFYFLLLHGWRSLTGESIFALRFLGAALSTLSVPLIYVLTTAVFKRNVGLITAVFMAISPIHIWHSQILRNYGLLLTLNLLSVYGLIRFLQSPTAKSRWLWLGVWAGAGLIGIFTHYFGFFVMAFSGLVLLIHFVWQWLNPTANKNRRPGRWVWIIMIVLLLLLIPLTITAYDRFQIGQQIDFYNTPPIDYFTHAIHAFSAGDIPGIIHPWWRVWPAAILVLLGILFGWRINRKGTVILLGYQLIPLVLLILLSAITPLYNGTRHLLFALPPFLIFCGTGMVGGWATTTPSKQKRNWLFNLLKWIGLGLGLVVVFIQGNRLYVQATYPNYIRDDVRGAAEYLNQHAQSEDIIILHDTLIGFTFDYYYDGAAPWQAVPEFGQLDQAGVTTIFANTGAVYGRVWFLSYPTPRIGFPREHLIDWADENWTHLATKSFPSFWLGTELRAYLASPEAVDIEEGINPITAVYPNLQLHGINHDTTMQAGLPWWLTLYWSAPTNESENYQMSLRLSDQNGQLWQQADISLWNDKNTPDLEALLFRTDHEINFTAGLSPGEYTLTLRVLDENLQPVPTSEGIIDLPLSQVIVASSKNPAQLPPLTPQTERMGPLTLQGYNLPSGEIKPGHVVPLDLYWQVQQTPKTDLQLRLELLDDAQTPIYEKLNSLSGNNYPPTSWQADEVLQTPTNLIIPGTAVAGTYAIRITLIDPEGQSVSKSVTLDSGITVDEWPLETNLPPVPNAIAATIGDPPLIQLHGIDLPDTTFAPDTILPLTLIWQALDTPDSNYVVFVHLVDADETILAQRDGMPVYGTRPTAGWRPDEVIIDQHDLYLVPSIPPGTYQLYVGLYNPETQERPLPQLNNEIQNDGRIALATITIETETE